jgi:hypothetical protein
MPVRRGYQEARPTLFGYDGTRHGFRKKELSAVACGGEKSFGEAPPMQAAFRVKVKASFV